MRKLLITALALAVASPLAAQTVVTPSSLNGWTLFDGKGSGDNATITSTNPFDGNGSLQLELTNGNQQPAAAYLFNSAVSLSSFNTLGFEFFSNAPANSVPTIRLLLTGLTNTGGSTTGSLGWFGTQGPTWQDVSLTDAVGNFFLRVTGKGQANDACANSPYGQSFDDRRQTIDTWDATCTGTGSTIGLANAQVIGVEVDYGSIPGLTGTSDVFADDVSFSLGGGTTSGDFNFETSAPTSTPEPGTLSLFGMGLVGLLGVATRKRAS